ncbi:hypothetical protein ANCDUO_04520 [Ancylostoma duodenale]|uniref:Tc1-like transposase DDE domain-containing protein n=1 Tax=Ancylostoma duodenale TaxID=51022 RepID=A0A0C2D6C1_9BILA|nr:hypothetical protein ANCDUO_04520 [Ancylostoma duodenale]
MWTFQQDGAPSHKSEETEEWIAKNFPDSISVNGILESIVCAKLHSIVEALKRDLAKVSSDLPMDIINRAVNNFPRRLKKCLEAIGGHFEQDQL